MLQHYFSIIFEKELENSNRTLFRWISTLCRAVDPRVVDCGAGHVVDHGRQWLGIGLVLRHI